MESEKNGGRSYLQSRNRDIGIDNKCKDTKGAKRGGELGLTYKQAHTSVFYRWLSGKESACNQETSLIPRSGRSPGKGNGYLLWYSCLETSMNRGAWCAPDHGPQRV